MSILSSYAAIRQREGTSYGRMGPEGASKPLGHRDALPLLHRFRLELQECGVEYSFAPTNLRWPQAGTYFVATCISSKYFYTFFSAYSANSIILYHG